MILGCIYILIIMAVIVSMAVLILKGKHTRSNHLYLACQVSVVLWCISQVLQLLAQNMLQQEIAYVTGNIGICFIGTFWILFAVCYVWEEKNQKKYPLWMSCVTGMISMFHFFMILTNEWHHLYYTVFQWKHVVRGSFFYSNVIYTYLCVILGAAILYDRWSPSKKNSGRDISGRFLIVVAVLLPLGVNAWCVFGGVSSRYDLTPLSFGISTILVLCATLRFRFMEVNITAFDLVVAGLDEGVAVFDKNGKNTYINPAFERVIGMMETMEELPEEIRNAKDTDTVKWKGRKQRVQRYHHEKMTVLVMRDVSEYYELLEKNRELAITDEKLALEKERNRIAQQVHDTTGHTLTMIQSLLKMEKLKGEDFGEDYLEQARVLAGNGIRELRESINQLRQEQKCELVTQGILQLAGQVKEIPVNVTIQGEDAEKYSHFTRILYDCFRESITNTLKYAKASRMDVVLRFQEIKIELIVADDGVGCKTIENHNGLSGIQNRIEAVHGQVRWITGEGEGFMMRISIPMEGEVYEKDKGFDRR